MALDDILHAVGDLLSGHKGDDDKIESSRNDPYGDPGEKIESSDNDPYGDPGEKIESSDNDPYGDPGRG